MMGIDHSANVLHLFTRKELCSAQLTNEALWAFFSPLPAISIYQCRLSKGKIYFVFFLQMSICREAVDLSHVPPL